jgi:hypothetical protein
MGRIILKILIFLFLALLILAVGVGYLLSFKPVMITPFTYTISEKFTKTITDAQNADLLIVGDRMGLYLNQFTPTMGEELAKELGRKPIIYNWSRENEGLHRTYYKLSLLKKIPPLIIYHGGSSEWFDQKFDPKEKDKIFYNFKQFNNEKIISAIITFPDLSRAIYKKVTLFPQLGLNKNLKPITESDLDSKEIEYKYYDQEIKELIDLVKRNHSNLIIITTPIKALSPPKEVCAISTTNAIVELQQEIENLLKEGNNKEAFTKAKALATTSMANAKSSYLLGLAAKNNSETKLAKEAFANANIFDCYNWRGNSVFNAILTRQANSYQIELIDFAKILLNTEMQDENVYFDEIFPQNLYYNNLMGELTHSIKKYLNIKSK